LRVVGLDLGTRRVGVAVSDDAGRVATAHGVVARTGDDAADRAALVAIVRDLGAGQVVVGLPLSLDGTRGPAARWATDEAEALAGLLDVPVALHDERLSTVSARRAPTTAARPRRAGGHRRSSRAPVDDQAAALVLQSWLDRTRNHPARPKERNDR
jgi:putative Holliday junction resolvase